MKDKCTNVSELEETSEGGSNLECTCVGLGNWTFQPLHSVYEAICGPNEQWVEVSLVEQF